MEFSPELQEAAMKYYKYAAKYNKSKGGVKRLLYQKMIEHKEKTFTLFRKEYKERKC